MKTRKGFVSNSSTSSFILSVDNDVPISEALEYELTLKGNLSNWVHTKIKTKEELDNYTRDNNMTFNLYSNYLKEIEKGRSIVIGEYSTESETCPDIFKWGINIGAVSNHPFKIRILESFRID